MGRRGHRGRPGPAGRVGDGRGRRVGRVAAAGRGGRRPAGRVRASPAVARGRLPATRRPRGTRRMSGLSVLLRKELLESWRTMRLPIVGRAVPRRRADLAVARPVPARDHRGGRRRPAAGHPDPDTGRRRRGRPAVEEPRPVRSVRGDRAGDGVRRHGTGSGHGRLRPLQDGLAWGVPRRQGRRARARAGGLRRAVGGGRLGLHRHPVRAAAGRWLDRVRAPGLAGSRGLGGHHVPRLDGDRVHGGRRRDRVRGAARPVAARRDPERGPVPAGRTGRAGRRVLPRARRSRSRT